MLDKFLRRAYFKIRLSQLLSRLEEIRNNGWPTGADPKKIDIFYSDVLEFPFAYYGIDRPEGPYAELIRQYSSRGNQSLFKIYATHENFLLELANSFPQPDIKDINSFSAGISRLLNELFDEISGLAKKNNRGWYLVLFAIITVGVVAAVYSPLRQRYLEEKLQSSLIENETFYKKQTLQDILTLKEALQRYYNDNNGYPKSSDKGWDAAITSNGKSKEQWIEGLAPKYIRNLPVDPRKSREPGLQYMYRSDGTNFKLIAHKPLGMSEVVSQRPEMADPHRPSWAFGVWTEGAKNW